jgi:hypothetical protein
MLKSKYLHNNFWKEVCTPTFTCTDRQNYFLFTKIGDIFLVHDVQDNIFHYLKVSEQSVMFPSIIIQENFP